MCYQNLPKEISIHAAREGGDLFAVKALVFVFVISIHAAREGGDAFYAMPKSWSKKFQSTPPVKAATSSSV